MPKCFCFYMDDSGSRDPDQKPKRDESSIDWFGLGGVLIEESDVELAKGQVHRFREGWPQLEQAPLHSYEIRNASGNFRWLKDKPVRERFMEGLSRLMIELPILATACVVHRPGYNARYRIQHGPRRWQLCKTAFPIAVERAAKFARHNGARLRVYVERSDPATERRLRDYYDELRATGAPFSPETSAKYAPLTADELRETLYDFKVKTKTSSLMQIADLALWPVCKGGYEPEHRPLKILRDQGKLLDSRCNSGNGLAGIKYSCFDP